MRVLLNNITGIFDKLSQVGVNKTDGANQSILEIRQRMKDLDIACDTAEKINKIVLKNIDKFDRRERILLDKYIDRFDKFD